MKKTIYIFLLIGFGLNAQSTLLFKSGFEGNVEVLPQGTGDWSKAKDYQGIIGSDEGFEWGESLIPSYGDYASGLHNIGTVNDANSDTYNELVTMIGHNGASTTVLKQHMGYTDYVGNNQVPYQINLVQNIPDKTYQRFWIKYDGLPHLTNDSNNGGRGRMLWQYKSGNWSDSGDEDGYRTSITLLGMNDGSGEVFWGMTGDKGLTGGKPENKFYGTNTYGEPDPSMGLNLDGWNLVEILTDWATDDTGQILFKLNGVEVFNRQNQRTLGPDDTKLRWLAFWQFYGSEGEQWIDDVEIWDGIPEPVTANAGEDETICENESVTLTATGGTTYLWSTGSSTSSITVSPSSTQTYTVTVSDSNGNSDTDDVIVTVNNVTANAGSDVTIDEGDSVTLTASGGDSYEWDTGANSQSITVNPNSTQNYTVTASSNGCDDTDTVRVTVNETTGSVKANAGSDVSICSGDSTTLTASGGSTYSWSTGATTASITVSPTSTQTYTVTVSDSNGNSDTDDVQVTANSVTANAGADVTIDEGDSVTLTASGGDSYVWNNGATTQSITVSPSSNENYTVTASSNGCDDTDTVRVNVNPSTGSVTANAGSDVSICSGESTILTASGGSTYSWNTGATTASIKVNPTSTQTYTVTVSDNGISDTDDVVVTVNSVTANAGSDVTIDEGDSVTLTASGGDSYVWNNGATTQSITVSPSSNQNYTVTASSNGCDDTDTVRVNVNPSTGSVTANAGSDVSICSGESTILTASGGSTYSWNTGATTASIKVNPTSTQTYTVTVSDSNGNSDTDDALVTVNSVTANAGSDRNIIEGETITLVATGGDTYLWSTGEKSESITVSPNSTQNYSVTAYTGACQDTDQVIVKVEPVVDSDPPPAQADAGEDMTICLGEVIILNGSGGETYQWSNGETSSSISVSPNRTSTYELFATRGGVTNSDSVTITVENCESEIISDEEDLAILEMAVYPNPTKGKLTILINNLDKDANFIINDNNGSLIYSDYISSGKKTQFERQINLSRYSNGLYFVRLYTTEQYLVKKVLVQ